VHSKRTDCVASACARIFMNLNCIRKAKPGGIEEAARGYIHDTPTYRSTHDRIRLMEGGPVNDGHSSSGGPRLGIGAVHGL